MNKSSDIKLFVYNFINYYTHYHDYSPFYIRLLNYKFKMQIFENRYIFNEKKHQFDNFKIIYKYDYDKIIVSFL